MSKRSIDAKVLVRGMKCFSSGTLSSSEASLLYATA